MDVLTPDVRLALLTMLPASGVTTSVVDRLDQDPRSDDLMLADGPGTLAEDQPVIELFLAIGVPTVYSLALLGIEDPPFTQHVHMRTP
jgi:hypothetical protein